MYRLKQLDMIGFDEIGLLTITSISYQNKFEGEKKIIA